MGLELVEHESVDGVWVLMGPVGQWDRRSSRWDKGPVAFIDGPLVDPFPEQFNLASRQGFACMRRRHQHVGILAMDPGQYFALLGAVRNDGWLATFPG